MIYLFQGFATALSLQNLFWALVGCFIGTLVGVLPGIGPASGIAILLPLTTVLPPTSAIIMMAAIYYGAMYGGSTTAIVVNIPGEASSVPTAIDGYEMAKQGKAGPALAICAISSFVAGTLGLIGLTFFAPLLADVAVVFGPPEYFALMFMALTLIISLSGRALLKGVISMALGLMTAMIGQDPLTGAARLTFGFPKLLAGIDFISVIVGLFAISEVMVNVESRITAISQKIGSWMPSWADIKQCMGPMLRSTGVGFFLGLLPGVTPSVTTFVAYDLEKRVSKTSRAVRPRGDRGGRRPRGGEQRDLHRRIRSALLVRDSHGALDGGPARRADDVRPSARADALQENPEFVWAVIASMYIGNVMLIVLNLPLVGMWARICVIPFYILGPLIVFFSVLGTYSIRFLAYDVWVMTLFGVIGYFMRKFGYPIAPMVLATVIAQMMETSLGQSMLMSQGSILILFTRPISAVFMALAFLSIVRGIWLQMRTKAPEVAIEEVD